MNIWSLCDGDKYKKILDLSAWRVVEAQHVSSSRDLVDTKDEHELLEALLENTKPKLETYQHYLIFTPFRYPPLKYGSRFGCQYEPSLWYGSIYLETAFAEVAYYRLKFFNDTEAQLDSIEIPMTAFHAHLYTESGIDLSASPFNQYQEKISSKTTYEYSQELGKEMRGAKIEAFLYPSARDKRAKNNVAAFIPEVFHGKNKPCIATMQNWRCFANQSIIEFNRDELLHRKHQAFARTEFETMA